MPKKLIIIAVSLLALGLILFAVVMSIYGWDFKRLSGAEFDTNEYTIAEEFKSISINTATANIKLLPTDGKCRVVCYESDRLYHNVINENGTLKIEEVDARKWYNYLWGFGNNTVTVYLPRGEYSALNIDASTSDIVIARDASFDTIDISLSTGDVECYASAKGAINIHASTGDISVKGLSALSLDLKTSTGEIEIEDVSCLGDIKIQVSTGDSELESVSCNSLISSGSTGDLDLEGVIAKERYSITRSTGDIRLKSCDAKEIFIETDTGDVFGTLLSDKIFFVSADTGDVDVPKTTTGGRCEITTDTGDVKIDVKS